jgi:hypothetical protein
MLKLDLCLSAEIPVMNLRSSCVVHGGRDADKGTGRPVLAAPRG